MSGKIRVEEMPESVQLFVECQLSSLRDVKRQLEQARKASRMFGAAGRYESEMWPEVSGQIEAAKQGLAKFCLLAIDNNVDPDAVIQQLGGIPDGLEKSHAAQVYDGEAEPIKPVREPGAVPVPVVHPPEVSQPTLDALAEFKDSSLARTNGLFSISGRDRYSLVVHLDRTSDPGIHDECMRGQSVIPRIAAAARRRRVQLLEERRLACEQGAVIALAERQAYLASFTYKPQTEKAIALAKRSRELLARTLAGDKDLLHSEYGLRHQVSQLQYDVGQLLKPDMLHVAEAAGVPAGQLAKITRQEILASLAKAFQQAYTSGFSG